MPSPLVADVRKWRNAALLAAFQAVKGTPVSDFSTSETRALQAGAFLFDPGIERDWSGGAAVTSKRAKAAAFNPLVAPIASLAATGTPRNIEWLLRSWGGPWAGSPLVLGMPETVDKFLTLGLVEDAYTAGSDQYLWRAWDMWAHTVRLKMRGEEPLEVEADLAGRDFDRVALNALGGITLPASFTPPSMGPAFTAHNFRLLLDPAGTPIALPVDVVEIEFASGYQQEHWNDRAPQVNKIGRTLVSVRIEGPWCDDVLALVDDAEDPGTATRRIEARWVYGSSILSIDMSNVNFGASRTGWNGKAWARFEAYGEAFLDEGDDSYLTVTLTP